MTVLASLASEVGVHERTLRRAVDEGALRAVRPTPRTLEMSLEERLYVRRHWPLIAELRAALRTEPNVRVALLIGSFARGEGGDASDVDLLVELEDSSIERVTDLSEKLATIVRRPVDITRFEDAGRTPAFLRRVVSTGRVLIDRDDRWAELRPASPEPADAEALAVSEALGGIDRILGR